MNRKERKFWKLVESQRKRGLISGYEETGEGPHLETGEWGKYWSFVMDTRNPRPKGKKDDSGNKG